MFPNPILVYTPPPPIFNQPDGKGPPPPSKGAMFFAMIQILFYLGVIGYVTWTQTYWGAVQLTEDYMSPDCVTPAFKSRRYEISKWSTVHQRCYHCADWVGGVHGVYVECPHGIVCDAVTHYSDAKLAAYGIDEDWCNDPPTIGAGNWFNGRPVIQ
jgi:hypothetical protein